jgi:hypothetical protein
MIKHILITCLLAYTTLAQSQNWVYVFPNDSKIQADSNVLFSYNKNTGIVTSFDTWIRDGNRYVQAEFNCLTHTMTVREQGKVINVTALDPGHPWWRWRNYGCNIDIKP